MVSADDPGRKDGARIFLKAITAFQQGGIMNSKTAAAREVLDGIKARHEGHVKCADCGKCRVEGWEEWCHVCDDWSCERGLACVDNPAAVDVARLTRAVEAVLELSDYWERTPALRKGTAASKVRAAIENALKP